jgi:hypothetical protein
VVYQRIEDLVSALQPIPGSGKPAVKPCLACLDRNYPTPIEGNPDDHDAEAPARERDR